MAIAARDAASLAGAAISMRFPVLSGRGHIKLRITKKTAGCPKAGRAPKAEWAGELS